MEGITTKELGGTLLIITEDGRTFGMRRTYISSIIEIVPDGDATYTKEEEKYFRRLWSESDAKNV